MSNVKAEDLGIRKVAAMFRDRLGVRVSLGVFLEKRPH
jgi:hypothetical protein